MASLAILSDLHGNLTALKAVLADLQTFPMDQVIVAGDVVNFGPCPRQCAETIITAKFIVIGVWSLITTLIVFGISIIVGDLIVLPGWSMDLFASTFVGVMGCALLTLGLIPFVAFIAGTGRGYLPPFGWTILTMVMAQFSAILGWGDRFPWAVPGLFSGAAGPRTEILGAHSYIILLIAFLIGLAVTYRWWRDADQTR